MTNKLVVVVNRLKYQKLRAATSCTKLQLPPEPLIRAYRSQIPVLSVLNLTCWNPPPPNKIPGYVTGGVHGITHVEHTAEIQAYCSTEHATADVPYFWVYRN